MEARDIIHPPDPRETVHAEVREVVRDVKSRPHVFLRVKLTGWHFPGRALLPFLLVDDVVSRFVVLARDGLSASAYFDRPLPAVNRVSFGYGRIVAWNFDLGIDASQVPRLNRRRLPPGTVDPFASETRDDDVPSDPDIR